MVYKDKLKRNILYKVRKGLLNNLSEKEIIKGLGNIPGTKQDIEQLIQDCKAYAFVNEIFENGNEKIAIKLANKYLEDNKNPSNIVKEKLATFYLKVGDIEKTREILLELLEEDAENRWTICKYFNLFKIEGKYEEALEFIETKREITKTDLPIFDIEFKILAAKKDINGLVKMCERISNLDFGKAMSDRKRKTYQLVIYMKILNKNVTRENRDGINEAIDLIKEKLNQEKEITRKIEEDNRKKNIQKENKVRNPKKSDASIIKSINAIIMTRKGSTSAEELKEKASEIEDELTRLILLCQIDNAYGRKGSDIAIDVKRFIKDKKELSEEDTKKIRILQNFLTSKDAKFYINDRWMDFQERYIFKSRTSAKNFKSTEKQNKDK